MEVIGEIQSRQVDRLIEQLKRRARNLRPAFLAIEQEIIDGIEEIFEREGVPGGESWPKLTPITEQIRAAEGNSGKMLQRTGGLAASVQTGNQITADTVIVSTNKAYAPHVHYGTRQKVTAKQRAFLGFKFKWWVPRDHEIVNPPRPFMLITDATADEAEVILAEHLAGKL